MPTSQQQASPISLVPGRGNLFPVEDSQLPGELLVGSLFALLTNWQNAEARVGRRGTYLTTGSMSFRVRTLTPELKQTLINALPVLNIGIEEKDLDALFSGQHEYQISFAINKFRSKVNSDFSAIEQRAIEKVRALLDQDDDNKRSLVLDRLAG